MEDEKNEFETLQGEFQERVNRITKEQEDHNAGWDKVGVYFIGGLVTIIFLFLLLLLFWLAKFIWSL
jgi:hypothetical protein